MSSRRTVILIAAVVVGALAAFALFNYIGGIEDRANDDARRVDVLVVKKDIPRGLTGQEAQAQGFIEKDEIPSKFKPATAVNDVSTVNTKVAIADLAAGQVLVEGMFADPVESQITASRRVPTGNVAITLSFDQVSGVAGLLVPGDYVNMLIKAPNDLCTATDAQGNTQAVPDNATGVLCRPARYLYQEVQILFVDKSPIPLPGETQPAATAGTTSGGLLTFAVPPAAAQILASVGAGIVLTLLPTDYAPQPLPPLDPFVALLPGEDGSQLTPYGPNGFQEQ